MKINKKKSPNIMRDFELSNKKARDEVGSGFFFSESNSESFPQKWICPPTPTPQPYTEHTFNIDIWHEK